MKKPLIILTGPTSVGKTETSIQLAKAVNAEIISADSVQVYKQMNIGSAKITAEEMDGVPHHLIDVLEPDEPFHVERFKRMAMEAMDKIYQKNRIPIVVGGTGFYIQALLYDIDFAQAKEDMAYRMELEELATKHGAIYLHDMLRNVDSISAEAIHPNNIKRVIRALEYFKETKTPISAHNEQQRQNESPYRFAYFVLNDERDKLYERINQRVDKMMETGLLEEVKSLQAQGYGRDLVSMQGIGYKEIYAYLDGECTLDKAIEQIKLDTRHFAKRQVTWFKREKDVMWINKDNFGYNGDKILDHLLSIVKEREIIQ
jgi:tRNA dimethylallyltransferase